MNFSFSLDVKDISALIFAKRMSLSTAHDVENVIYDAITTAVSKKRKRTYGNIIKSDIAVDNNTVTALNQQIELPQNVTKNDNSIYIIQAYTKDTVAIKSQRLSVPTDDFTMFVQEITLKDVGVVKGTFDSQITSFYYPINLTDVIRKYLTANKYNHIYFESKTLFKKYLKYKMECDFYIEDQHTKRPGGVYGDDDRASYFAKEFLEKQKD